MNSSSTTKNLFAADTRHDVFAHPELSKVISFNIAYSVGVYMTIQLPAPPQIVNRVFYDHQGAAMGGARADFTPQFAYMITIDPEFMNSLPRLGTRLIV
jgi:hypothetical protein